jgi:methylthioribose-1-phosphate isomerase
MSVLPIIWHKDRLELLDQRLLPGEIHYVPCITARDVTNAIREMVVRGAPAIGIAAGFGLALEARRLSIGSIPSKYRDAIQAAALNLIESRPTAVNLKWAVDRVLAAASSLTPATNLEIMQAIENAAENIYRDEVEACRSIGIHGQGVMPRGARIMTHCNAGALATGEYGTALGVIRAAYSADDTVTVVATETRPYLQGARLTSWELTTDGIPVTLIVDGASGWMMANGHVDVVVVGADRVARNGDTANKVGTYTIATLAKRHQIPFYVACPYSTLDPSVANGNSIVIEERDPDEVRGFGGVRWAAPNVLIKNPSFDVTPAELITGFITEGGVVKPPFA